MASGSGSAPAGDGTPLSPLSLSVVHASHVCTHTVNVYTRVDLHLIDLKFYHFLVTDVLVSSTTPWG
jgi:hypothetical protein